MATGPGYPAATNVYVPNHEASGNLIIGYSRNAKKFRLPQWAQYVEASKPIGLYLKLSSQEQVRVVSQDEYAWPDGQYRPVHTDGLEAFNYKYFGCQRFDYGFTLGQMTADLASWPVVQQHLGIHATKCMTARTIRMLSVLTTTANWGTAADPDLSAAHTDTATNFAGGQLNAGTAAAPYIRNFMTNAAVLIDKETAGVVDVENDLVFMINPNQASLWGKSAEIRDYIKGSYAAREEIIDGLNNPNSKFGLPARLYGYKVLVENATKITSRRGAATLTKAYAMPDQQVLAISRVGGLVGVEGGPSFSTATLFWYKDEMTVETFADAKHRLTEGHVTENTAEVLTSPLSGYLLTASTATAGP